MVIASAVWRLIDRLVCIWLSMRDEELRLECLEIVVECGRIFDGQTRMNIFELADEMLDYCLR